MEVALISSENNAKKGKNSGRNGARIAKMNVGAGGTVNIGGIGARDIRKKKTFRRWCRAFVVNMRISIMRLLLTTYLLFFGQAVKIKKMKSSYESMNECRLHQKECQRKLDEWLHG